MAAPKTPTSILHTTGAHHGRNLGGVSTAHNGQGPAMRTR